jgi:phosphatidylinositol N-acetylglucosaminyltransferase subunit Y
MPLTSVQMGAALLCATGAALFAAVYCAVLSKMFPSNAATHPLLGAIAADRHYCLVAMALIPVAVFMGFLNWLGLKYYRHN